MADEIEEFFTEGAVGQILKEAEEEAEKAGIKKFEYDCIDKCESKSKTQSGYRTLERKMTCVDKPCSEIPACLRAK